MTRPQCLRVGRGGSEQCAAWKGSGNAVRQYIVDWHLVGNSVAPGFIACTVLGAPPRAVTTIIGMSVRSMVMRFCSAWPSSPERDTPSTRQVGRRTANVSGCRPIHRIGNSSDSRTGASSTTTNTVGRTSEMALPRSWARVHRLSPYVSADDWLMTPHRRVDSLRDLLICLGGYPATFVASAHQQESRYKSVTITIVQLFFCSASVLITGVARSNRDARREEYGRTT